MNMRYAAALAALMVLCSAPALAEDNSDLAARVAAWQQAFNSGDDAALVALYTDDCMRLPYQAPAISGKDQLLANLATVREAGVASVELTATEGSTHGNTGWGRGTYTLKDAEGNVVQSGKWLNVSKKVGGAWLIHRDIWNTDAAPE